MKHLNIFATMTIVILAIATTGCRTDRALMARLGEVATNQVIQSTIQNEIEGPRGTTVNVNNAPANNYNTDYYNGNLQNGNHYAGQTLNSYPHGYGTMTTTENAVYAGYFAQGKANGQGELTFSNGKKYRGNFVNGNLPYGTMTVDNWIYVGGFNENLIPHGYGEIKIPQQDITMKGNFVNGDLPYGTSTCRNGTFVGTFKDLTSHVGTFTGNDGTVLTGTFRGETKAGKINYPDGRKYDGEWNGQPDFNDEMERAKLGYWIYERPHGIGKMIYPSGKVEEGIWNKGKFIR